MKNVLKTSINRLNCQQKYTSINWASYLLDNVILQVSKTQCDELYKTKLAIFDVFPFFNEYKVFISYLG